MLIAVTPTRNRPVAVDLLADYMRRQKRYPERWFVVNHRNDGEESSDRASLAACAWAMPLDHWYAGPLHSLCANLIAVERQIQLWKASQIAVLDDDDWYHPEYLERLVREAEGYDVTGFCPAHYYHVGDRSWRCMNNKAHASLGMSIFSPKGWQRVVELARRGRPQIDLALWRTPQPDLRMKLVPDITASDGRIIQLGMKGLPGEPGIGIGHKRGAGRPDPNLTRLREWIGDDADLYAGFHSPAMVTDGA